MKRNLAKNVNKNFIFIATVKVEEILAVCCCEKSL